MAELGPQPCGNPASTSHSPGLVLSDGILTVGCPPWWTPVPGLALRENSESLHPHRSQGGSKGVSEHPRTDWQVGCGVWDRQAPALGPVLTGHSVPPPQACRDFLELAETHSRKWQRALQYEQEQRIHLEETIEQLAKQHNSLERAFRSAPGRATNPTKSFSEGEWARATLPGWVPCSGLLSLCSFQSVLCLHLLLPAGSAYTAPPAPPVHMPLNMPTFRPASVALYFPHPLPKGNYLPAFRFQFL